MNSGYHWDVQEIGIYFMGVDSHKTGECSTGILNNIPDH